MYLILPSKLVHIWCIFKAPLLFFSASAITATSRSPWPGLGALRAGLRAAPPCGTSSARMATGSTRSTSRAIGPTTGTPSASVGTERCQSKSLTVPSGLHSYFDHTFCNEFWYQVLAAAVSQFVKQGFRRPGASRCVSLYDGSIVNMITFYDTSTGWHITLIQTSCWHQHKSYVLVN